ncbi:flavodoxin family protein [Hymenobacter crusticola]|uniref:NADPH-dependent FMN reductase-like domain-containing protein n=1 Tax=Hymenobacter crusticola TaxID=1770526 RepID=A0A243W6R5_9BACT|nr:NAD(P)H-dependent oxidoreductase [Hymenobacter crusticola]OUJ69890.1 hypothetical protein BXP70_25845 [Hymenobacter crusticola]
MTAPVTSLPLVIVASARREGDTARLVEQVLHEVPHHLLHLLDWLVLPYRYEQDYPVADHFLPLVEQILQHPALILATPVYWYSMSGPLKGLLDRFTDLITTHKQLGRQLAGKPLFVLASGSDPDLPEGFDVPFRRTAAYFNMPLVARLYSSTKRPFLPEEAHQFIQQLLQSQQSG